MVKNVKEEILKIGFFFFYIHIIVVINIIIA